MNRLNHIIQAAKEAAGISSTNSYISAKGKAIAIIFYAVYFVAGLYIFNLFSILKNPLSFHEDFSLLGVLLRIITENTLLFLLYLILGVFLGIILAKKVSLDTSEDSRGLRLAKDKTQGVAQELTEREKRNIYELRNYFNPSGIILGKDKKSGEVITIPWKYDKKNMAPTNGNILIVGESGTRKTTGFLLGNIFSCMEEGHSIVTTDPKGEIYSQTIAAAIERGYEVRIFNIMSEQFIFSDGWDVLKLVRESANPQNATDIIVNTILDNISVGMPKDFWYTQNKNLLKLAILTVAIAEGYVPRTSMNNKAKGRTFQEVCSLVYSADMKETIASLLGSQFNRKYLFEPFSTWTGHDQWKNVRSNLALALELFQNKELSRILSEDEIDFRDLDRKKTIIYLMTTDKDSVYQPVLALFSTMMFREVTDIADKKSANSEKKHLDRPLTIFFEEFDNVGYIPDLAKKIATIRSRWINMIFCYQNIGQLKGTYTNRHQGKEEWQTIVANCAMRVCCGAGDLDTAEFFSKYTGQMTIEEESVSYDVGVFSPKILRFSERESIRKSNRGRAVYLPSDILSIQPDEILLCRLKHNSTIEKKYYYKHHPLYQYQCVDELGNIKMHDHFDHIPKWRIRDMEAEGRLISGNKVSVMEDPIKIAKFENLHKRQAASTEETSKLEDFFEKIRNKAEESDALQSQMQPVKRNAEDFLISEVSDDLVVEQENEERNIPKAADEDDWFINGLF